MSLASKCRRVVGVGGSGREGEEPNGKIYIQKIFNVSEMQNVDKE